MWGQIIRTTMLAFVREELNQAPNNVIQRILNNTEKTQWRMQFCYEWHLIEVVKILPTRTTQAKKHHEDY